MKFFFDESGDFTIPREQTEHRVAVVMGVAVSELIEQELSARYEEFVSSLDQSECANGEPKGLLLTNEHRKQFCELLVQFDGISINPVTLDLSSLAGSDHENLNQNMSKALRENSEKMIYKTAREQLLLKSRQFYNLSPNQALRIYSWTNCFREALHHAIIFLSNRGYEACWDDLRFEIDRVQVHRNSREEQVFSLMVLAWLTGWSRSHPFTLVKEIHTPDHPFVQKYNTHDGVDIGKLIRGNIHWVNSSDSWGLQIADIASNIVFQAVTDLTDRQGALSLYASLMRNSYYGPVRGPGLFSPLSDPSEETAQKYYPLSQVMSR